MTNIKITKKSSFIISLLLLIITLFSISQTYAKYISSANSIANMTIAKWRILINNEDIRNNTVLNQVITPTFNSSNHIANNVIAPTSTGYFELTMDCSMADVSFTYNITAVPNSNSPVSDIIMTGYSINEGDTVTIARNNQTITGNILQENNVQTINIRVFIMWDDSVNATMNNNEDTNTTLLDTGASLDVNMNFVQYNGST